MKKSILFIMLIGMTSAVLIFLYCFNILTLKSAIEYNWNKDLSQLKYIFPGGKLKITKMSRALDYYTVNVRLFDINALATLLFHQGDKLEFGETIKQRSIVIRNDNPIYLKEKFDEINQHIKHIYPKIFTDITDTQESKKSYRLSLDEKLFIRIDLYLKSEQIKIDITKGKS